MLNLQNFPNLVDDDEVALPGVTFLGESHLGAETTAAIAEHHAQKQEALTKGQRSAVTRKINAAKKLGPDAINELLSEANQDPESEASQIIFKALDGYGGPHVAAPTTEGSDPNGIDQHAPGAKLDAGKLDVGFLLASCPLALLVATAVLDYGRTKYTEGGWQHVEDGVHRYTSAGLRHMLSHFAGEAADAESLLLHEAHELTNKLFSLELRLRQAKESGADIVGFVQHSLAKG